MSIISAKNIAIGYDGKVVADKISFQVEKGDYLCIVGENGAGKSTLMKTLLGLVEPVCGEIILGEGLTRNEIGYLPQQTLVQRDFPASVEEVVLSGCQGRRGLHPFYTKEDKQLAKDNIRRMGITHLSKSCYRNLSGGQQQRVLLARALCATGTLLVLDEPVAGLDPAAVADLYELIQQLNEEGITVIMISHDISVAIKYASHVLHMDRNAFFGSRADYLESAAGRKFLFLHEEEVRS